MRGSRFKHFQILAPLGSGGMGEVYLALDTTLERRIALKFLPRSLTGDPAAQGRLLDEARTCSRIQHPNVAVVHSIEEDGGIFAICMEYVEGMTVRELIGSRPLPLRQVLSIATGIADGLHAAHELKVIHRDLKPANVIVTDHGEVKVMDFGLALRPARTVQTAGPESFGTVAYMSPEQARGRELDRSTDIFSFGSTIYEMLAGRLPFEGENDLAVLQAIIGQEPPPLREVRRDVPPALDRLVRCCMEKDKERRHGTMAAVAEDLRTLQPIVESGPKDLIGELASGLRDKETRLLRPSGRQHPTRLSPTVARTAPAPGTSASVADVAVAPSPPGAGAAGRGGARGAAGAPGRVAARGAARAVARAEARGDAPGAARSPGRRAGRAAAPAAGTSPAAATRESAAVADEAEMLARYSRRRIGPKAILGIFIAFLIVAMGIFVLGRMSARHAAARAGAGVPAATETPQAPLQERTASSGARR